MMFRFLAKVAYNTAKLFMAIPMYGVATVVGALADYWHDKESDSIAAAKLAAEKARLVEEDQIVIGLRPCTDAETEPRIITKPATFTRTKFDTTTWPDRAIFTLTNSTAGSLTCTGISIQGRLVIQHDEGYLWEYKDYANIATNGEMAIEISNRFIIDTDQIESIGDYVMKELVPHSMYQLQLPGCHFEYEIGDTWHLTLSYTISGQPSEAELIDTDVDVTSVSFSRSVGGIGETILEVRVPSGVWSKTTSRRARLISAGLSQWLNKQSGTLIVAASDYTGQADYYCDGTADDVQIQAAIDYGASNGGGVVELTKGVYYISSRLDVVSNIILNGSGNSTILKIASLIPTTVIDASGDNIVMSNFVVDGNASSVTYDEAEASAIFCNGIMAKLDNITVQNFKHSRNGNPTFSGFVNPRNAFACVVKNIEVITTSSTGNAVCVGFNSGDQLTACTVSDLIATGNGGTSETDIWALYFCTNVNNTKTNTLTASGGASNMGAGFVSCSKITNCGSVNAAANSTGFYNCRSTQQCKSTSNANHYSGSYADAGTSNLCADTAAGGYNS